MSTWVHADFNGLLEPDLLCLAHQETDEDRDGKVINLRECLQLTAYDEDEDEEGRPDTIFATGRVERSPGPRQATWLEVVAPDRRQRDPSRVRPCA